MTKFGLMLFLGGVLCHALVIGMQVANPIPSEHLQFALWILGLILYISFAMKCPRGDFVPDEAQISPSINWRLVLFLVGLAFAIRFPYLQRSLPQQIDELSSLNQILSLWRENVPLLLPINANLNPTPFLFPYFQNYTVGLWGADFVGLRLIAVIFGSLTVGALYFLAQELSGDSITAWVSALALTGLPLHIHFSRLGLINVADPLVGTLLMLFVARAWRTNLCQDWVLGGTFVGLTAYFWEAGERFFPLFLGLWLAWLGVFNWHLLRDRWRGLLWLIGMAALIQAPIGIATAISGVSDGVSSRLAQMGLNRDVFAVILTSTADDIAFQNYLRGILRAYGVLAVGQVMYYYGWHLPQFNVEHRADRANITDAMLRSVGFPADGEIVIVTTIPREPLLTEKLQTYPEQDESRPHLRTLKAPDPVLPETLLAYLTGDAERPRVRLLLTDAFVREMEDADFPPPAEGWLIFVEAADTAAIAAIEERFAATEYTSSPNAVPESKHLRGYRAGG